MSVGTAGGGIAGDSVVQRRSDLAAIELDGELVLYDEHSGEVHRLNATASIVWQCLDGESSLTEVAYDLAAAFSVDEADMERDVVGITAQFAETGLLRDGSRRSERADVPEHGQTEDDGDLGLPRYIGVPPSG